MLDISKNLKDCLMEIPIYLSNFKHYQLPSRNSTVHLLLHYQSTIPLLQYCPLPLLLRLRRLLHPHHQLQSVSGHIYLLQISHPLKENLPLHLISLLFRCLRMHECPSLKLLFYTFVCLFLSYFYFYLI